MEALVWVDIETTGLEPRYDLILELAVKVTDFALKPLMPTETFLFASPGRIDAILGNPLIKNMHETSGLLAELMDPAFPKSDAWAVGHQLDGALADLRDRYAVETFYLAGASVHFDRSFLKASNAGKFLKHLSHRHFDVTTLKLFLKMLGYDQEFETVRPEHRAANDIESSILVVNSIQLTTTGLSDMAAHLVKMMENES